MVRSLSLALSFLLFVGVALFLSFCSDQKKTKKAELAEAPTQYAAHKPDVHYVGKKACVSCHQDIYETFQHTGKGRSFYEPSRNNIIEDFSKGVVYDKPSDFYYRAFWKGPEMFIAEFRLGGSDTVHYRQEKVDFVVGSGNQTRTYIWEQNGYFFELPITWYVSKKIWDMSPGYEGGNNTRFDRPIGDLCMNCHNSEQQFVPASVNRFTSVGMGMSCEKCHGPGEAHVNAMQTGQKMRTGAIDFTIVNPAKLPIQLQFDVCRQCHLEGVAVPKPGKDITDYRPGIALTNYFDVFLPVANNTEEFGFASHAERLQMAPCFVQSKGKLTCTTCHDPHKPLPKDEVLFYNQKCQSCHNPTECDVEHTKMLKADNNCAGCHMPKSGTTDIPHVSSTDHFIRKNPGKNDAETNKAPASELVTFKSFTSDSEEGDRAHVLANLIYYEQFGRNPGYLERTEQYIKNLELDYRIKYAFLRGTALPDDLKNLQPNQVKDGYSASYIAEINRKAKQPALAWAQRAVELAPSNIEFQVLLARLHFEAKNVDQAKAVYEKVLQLQPKHEAALASLGFIYLELGNFPKALEMTQKSIAADPDYLLPQENLATIYLQQGEYKKGLEQLNKLIARNPSNANYKALRERVLQLM